jgi:hypothetical protein
LAPKLKAVLSLVGSNKDQPQTRRNFKSGGWAKTYKCHAWWKRPQKANICFHKTQTHL